MHIVKQFMPIYTVIILHDLQPLLNQLPKSNPNIFKDDPWFEDRIHEPLNL